MRSTTMSSNLGGYQNITKIIKTLGGPKASLVLLATGISFIGFGSFTLGKNYAASKKGSIENDSKLSDSAHAEPNSSSLETKDPTYTASVDFDYDGGLTLRAGDTFRVVQVIDEMVFIEMIGESNNPYLVSIHDLNQYTDYNHPTTLLK